MIKPARFLTETHDMYCRRVYVVRPRSGLLQRLTELGADSDDCDYLGAPVVVMTEEAPFERDMEGWGPAILQKCKETFLAERKDDLARVGFDVPVESFNDPKCLSHFFNEWWIHEEAEDFEIVARSWMT